MASLGPSIIFGKDPQCPSMGPVHSELFLLTTSLGPSIIFGGHPRRPSVGPVHSELFPPTASLGPSIVFGGHPQHPGMGPTHSELFPPIASLGPSIIFAPAVHVFRPERRTGEPENRSRGDRAEWTPTTERVGGIPLPNQIRAETPGMHQTKPHPRSSPCASKRRKCWDARSVQDEDRGQGRLRIDRNSYLEVQDGPGSQRSGRTDRQRRK
ncbi:hypothetical protein BJV77DRAFT_967945 [Russula vinacea]|nr:hypothetical protein BJV77DRAFT_967945 [Russula vinacea]